MARGVFNSNIFALQTGDGSGQNWVNKLYFDAVTGKYIFDGMLSATMIEALEAEFDVTISNTFITQTLAAESGYIAQLTVDSVETSTKVQNHLNEDTSDVNYIKIFKQYIHFITASTDGTQAEQAKDRNGANLFWLDNTHKGTTLKETDYPVQIYKYEEFVKAEITFVSDGTNYFPQLILGVGDGTGANNAKAFIYKGTKGLEISYYRSNVGHIRQIKLDDDGIFQVGSTGTIGLRNIAVSNNQPLNPQVNDLWIDTSGGYE
jgi:hypothetical protein